ncbi:hypothetical protein [Jeongeupia sp. HS-3]|uniref:hypothetical protein n=1 Tax=Jeongeupia sp. HS-3 TaxID=1009682 RepID=UPI001F1A8AEA|nr:hypothetical protein [Jeongeupia sp. HS-3]
MKLHPWFKRIALAALVGLPAVSFAAPGVEVGFSPEGSARTLVLQTIGSAKKASR